MKNYDLEKAANEYANSIAQHEHNKIFSIYDFKAGANWRYEQFEKNRLAACDNMTKEEFDREQEFTTDFIEKNHRIPTYSDAIEYGRRLMINKACEWLENNLSQEVSIISGGYVHINFENSIKEFRKALEE